MRYQEDTGAAKCYSCAIKLGVLPPPIGVWMRFRSLLHLCYFPDGNKQRTRRSSKVLKRCAHSPANQVPFYSEMPLLLECFG